MNTLYRRQFVARIEYALAAARAVAPLEHTGVKGAVREVLVADLFRPLLPSDIGLATGVLVSSFDEAQSGQQDIIVFDRRIVPPIAFEQGPAIIPIESALAVIEVKSTLTATELRKAHASLTSFDQLAMSAESGKPVSGSNDIRGWLPATFLFALDTDLTENGESEKDRYLSLFPQPFPSIRALCVAGRGAWFPLERGMKDRASGRVFNPDTGKPFENLWKEIQADADHSEVLEILIGLHTVIETIGKTRGRPHLGLYLRDDSASGSSALKVE